MIAPLRKRHFRMWVVIAIVLPVATIAAYTMAPEFPNDDFTIANTNFPELLQSVVSQNYMFNIKKNYESGTVLEVVQISKINPASELVTLQYVKKSSKNKTKQVLGIMGENKTYLFNLKGIQPPFTIEVKDTIKQEVLSKVDF